MGNNDLINLNPEEIVDRLIHKLSECNTLVSLLSKKSTLDTADLRKLRNELMFTRTKARNLAKTLDDMKRPVDAFRLSS